MRSYINTNNRRNSPLFLAGEDFGTGRAAGLAAYLIEHRIPVQGVALFSMTLSADATAGDAQYITLLPSLIMAAWNHKKLSPELNAMSAEQIAGQARQFASREYLHALYKGDRMTPEERTKVIADLSRLTGLSKAFLVNNDLRVTLDRFNTEIDARTASRAFELRCARSRLHGVRWRRRPRRRRWRRIRRFVVNRRSISISSNLDRRLPGRIRRLSAPRADLQRPRQRDLTT